MQRTTRGAAQRLDELAPEVVVQPAVQQRVEAGRAEHKKMTDRDRHSAHLRPHTAFTALPDVRNSHSITLIGSNYYGQFSQHLKTHLFRA